MTCRIVLIFVAVLFLLNLTGTNQAVAKQKADYARAEAPVDWNSIVIKPVCSPRFVQGSDKKWNLVYELVVTNYSPKPIHIKKLEVLSSKNGTKPLFKLKGKSLTKSFTCIASPHSRTKLKPGESGVAWINIEYKTKPQSQHKLICKFFLIKDKKKVENLAIVKIDKKPPVVIGAPLSGKHWLAMGGYAGVLGHRKALMPIGNRLVLSQRYAIDWVKFDDKWNSWQGSWKDEKNSVCYGEPMLAVADGTIVGAIDGFKDQPPFEEARDLAYPGGNCITLDIGNGLYAFYAHIKPGSLKVKRGDKVKKGEVIAIVGNSGHSFEPHLHFHITDKPEILSGRGIPYVIESFTFEGEARKLNRFATNKPRLQPAPVKFEKNALKHKNQLPKEGAIVTF